jgi:hypothetical protein
MMLVSLVEIIGSIQIKPKDNIMEASIENQINQTEQVNQTKGKGRTRNPDHVPEKRPRYFICASGNILEQVRADSKEQAITAFNDKHGTNPVGILDGEGAGYYAAKNYAKPLVEEVSNDFIKAKEITNMDDLQTTAQCVIQYKGHKMNAFEMIQSLGDSVQKYYFIRQAPEKIDENAPNLELKGSMYLKENSNIKIEQRTALNF